MKSISCLACKLLVRILAKEHYKVIRNNMRLVTDRADEN